MSALAFVNPAYLGALALAGIPILIHLMRKRRVRIVPWAAWEFLLTSTRRNRRRFRIEQILLLLVRIAIVALAVLAFSRPLLRTLGAPTANAAGRCHALIVLDTSFSMGHRREGVSEFDRAKRIADEIVTRALKPGDSGSLLLLSSKPTAAIGEPTYDLLKLRAAIRAQTVSDRGTDYAATAEAAAKLLAGVRSAAREVYWITDSRRAGFPAESDRLAAAWRQMAALARVTWIDVAGGEHENLSVDAPTFSRELVTPGMPVRIEAEVHNGSRRPADNLLVNLEVDGAPAGSAAVHIQAEGSARASFLYPFDRAGIHVGRILLGTPDDLAADNSSVFAVRVRDRLRVLLLNGHPNTDPAKDEAFYLSVALAPQAASEGGRAPIRVTERTGTSLNGIDLTAQDVVVLSGFTELGPSDRKPIEDFVRAGGGLLIFPGANANPSRMAASLGNLLPCRIGARRATAPESAPTINTTTITHPALAAFRDTSQVVLGTARFTVTYDLSVDPAQGRPDERPAAPMVSFSDGRPALVERPLGLGKVILAACTSGAGGSDLPYKPAYVPLMHQLVSYLAAGPASQRILRVDQPVTLRFDLADAGKPVRLTRPNGATLLLRSALGPEGVVFSYSGADRAGIYRISLGGSDRTDAFAVNLPQRESDLAWADEAHVRAALGGAAMQYARGSEDVLSVVRRGRHGVEIWRSLVWTTLLLLFVEALLARRFGRRG